MGTIFKYLNGIYGNMNWDDSLISKEDINSIAEYEKEKKEGKLISHETLKKELGL